MSEAPSSDAGLSEEESERLVAHAQKAAIRLMEDLLGSVPGPLLAIMALRLARNGILLRAMNHEYRDEAHFVDFVRNVKRVEDQTDRGDLGAIADSDEPPFDDFDRVLDEIFGTRTALGQGDAAP